MATGNIILHIFPQEKFTDNYVFNINKYFGEKNHVFYIYQAEKQISLQCIEESNVVFFNSIDRMFRQGYLFKISKKIIIHGGWSGLLLAFDKKYPELVKKTYIVFWGGDIYGDLFPLNGQRLLLWYKKRAVIKRSAAVINLIAEDYKQLQKRYFLSHKHYVAGYSQLRDYEKEKQLADNYRQQAGVCTNILIGNSATESNQHFKAIDMVKKFKDENIKVYFPLSYGDTQYAKKVMRYAKTQLMDKCVFLTEFMEFEEYIQLLSTMSIAIFMCNRQQAMGNISILLSMGAKVFMLKNTSMWKRYRRTVGCIVYDVREISKRDFKDFCNMSDKTRWHNYRCFESLGVKAKMDAWNRIFLQKI